MYTETIVACVSAGNEATVHCVLLHELIRFSSFQKPQKTFPPPPLVQILQVKYAQGQCFFICGRWSNFSEEVHIVK